MENFQLRWLPLFAGFCAIALPAQNPNSNPTARAGGSFAAQCPPSTVWHAAVATSIS